MRIKIFIGMMLVLLVGAYPLAAQQDTTVTADTLRPRGSIQVLAKARLDSVILRWAPDNPAAWIKTRQTGYMIKRAKVDTLSEFDSTAVETLTDQPILPWTLETFKKRVPEDNDFALLAAEALYGERFVVEPMGGDNPIEALRNASDELNNRFGFALLAADNSVLAAEGLGLRYVDRNVEDGATYIYTVLPAAVDTTYPIESGSAVVDIESTDPPPPPLDLKAQPGESSIMLSWKELPDEAYSGYYVYRSSDGGENFEQMNDEPHFFLTGEQPDGTSIVQFVDTSAVNYKRYHYRVRGVTPFAELSQSAEVSGMARDMTPPPVPSIKMPQEVGPQAIKVTWTYPDTVKDLEGFYISKSDYQTFESSQSLMEEPLPAYARSYVDSSASTDRPWYFVIAVDTAGNAIPSFGAYGELIDRVPPSKPTGLTGKIDTTGTVQLAWDLGPEEDIIGYRLLYANDPTHEFSTVTSMIVRDTVYTDSIAIKTLTKSIYYRIAAIDERHNQSEFSDLLKLERPDIVPPVPSVFSDVSVSDSTVTLEWNISPSKDLMRQVLYRRAASADASWDSLAGLSRTIRSYTDTTVSPNTRYRYRIQAVDSAGLRSKFASTVQARPYDTGIRKPPQLTSVDYDSSRKVIEIRWTYSDAIDEEYYFVIYRANGNGVPESYKALPGDQRQFTDRTIQTGKIYRYAVKVKMRSGAQSKLSTQREVNTGGQSP